MAEEMWESARGRWRSRLGLPASFLHVAEWRLRPPRDRALLFGPLASLSFDAPCGAVAEALLRCDSPEMKDDRADHRDALG